MELNSWQKGLAVAYSVYLVYVGISLAILLQAKKNEGESYASVNKIDQKIIDFRSKGRWSSASTDGLLNNNSGEALMILRTIEELSEDESSNVQTQVTYLELYLFDPVYRDEHFLLVLQPLERTGSYSFKFEGELAPYARNLITYANIFDYSFSRREELFGELEFIAKDKKIESISLVFHSSNGNLRIETNLAPVADNSAIGSLLFVCLMISLSFLGAQGGLAVLARVEDNNMHVRSLSMSTVLLVCVQDCFLFLLAIQFGNTVLSSVDNLLLAATYFSAFCFLDYRLLLFIWRYSKPEDFYELTDAQFRNRLFCFQLQVYGCILSYLYLHIAFFVHPLLLALNGLALFPQTIHHAMNPEPPEWRSDYILGFVSTKYLALAYYRLPYNNFLKLRPNLTLVLFGAMFLLLSIILLKAQERIGPSIIIPSFLRKSSHNYFVELTAIGAEGAPLDGSSLSNQCCAICLSEVSREAVNESNIELQEIKNKAIKRALKKKGDGCLMLTPCNHYFHPSCLGKWMEVKMECPQCRKALPSII